MYSTLQVLRTKVPLKSIDGKQVSPRTRVVVMSIPEKGRVKVKVADPAHPALESVRLIAKDSAFTLTHRGRPRKA